MVVTGFFCAVKVIMAFISPLTFTIYALSSLAESEATTFNIYDDISLVCQMGFF